ncbi:MAG: YggT family protein [Candidatus Latescibacteria bacterium]|nr:YggT family protein [Candidatus Latescibacterota bacterium]
MTEPSIKFVVRFVLTGFTYLIRGIAVSLSFLLVLRSISIRFFPANIQNLLRSVYAITDVFIFPVRQILPAKTCSLKNDFSPLVTAIIILLLGLGMEELIKNFDFF